MCYNKRMEKILNYVAAAGAGLLIGAGGLAGFNSLDSTSPHVRTPKETIYSWVYNLKNGNYGNVCKFLEPAYVESQGGHMSCVSAYAFGVVLGYDFSGVYVVPQSEKVVDENTVTYKIKDKTAPDFVGVAKIIKDPKDGAWYLESIE